MPRAPSYAEAFSPLPGRCFRMVAHHGEAGPAHFAQPVAWRGSWRALNGRRYRVEACEAAVPSRSGAAALLASLRSVVSADAEVKVDPVALEFEFVDLTFAVVLAVMLAVVPGLGAGRLAPAGSVTPVLAGHLVVCLAADLSLSCRYRPGPPSSLA